NARPTPAVGRRGQYEVVRCPLCSTSRPKAAVQPGDDYSTACVELSRRQGGSSEAGRGRVLKAPKDNWIAERSPAVGRARCLDCSRRLEDDDERPVGSPEAL